MRKGMFFACTKTRSSRFCNVASKALQSEAGLSSILLPPSFPNTVRLKYILSSAGTFLLLQVHVIACEEAETFEL